MNIAILSRGTFLYSTQSLLRSGIRRGHHIRVVDHTQCDLLIEKGRPRLYYEDRRLEPFDAIIPRIGASVTAQGAAVINQMEMMGAFTVAKAEALLRSRDKLRCLQRLARCGIHTPRTVSVSSSQSLATLVHLVGGFPVVMKLLESTHGAGVLMAEDIHQAEALYEAFQRVRERVIIQEFIPEAKGADIRALVVGGEVVATMRRQAQAGEFRSNLHRGATAEPDQLTPTEEKTVINAARIMGLDVAGVDLLRSNRASLVLEVNASPGLEGIEGTTQVDVAGKIFDFIENRVQQLRNVRTNLKKSGR